MIINHSLQISNQLKSILSVNTYRDITIIGFFSNYPVNNFFIEQKSVLIYGESDHLWTHIASSSIPVLESLLSKHHEVSKYYFSAEVCVLKKLNKNLLITLSNVENVA